METRKVQQVGGGTYTVSLPIRWAEEHDLEAGATVYLSAHRDGSLVVRREEKENSELAGAEVELAESDPAVAKRVLEGAYAVGFDRIALRAPDGITAEGRRAIEACARGLPGVEVVEWTDTRVTVRGMLDAGDVSIRQSVLQLRFSALAVHGVAMDAFRGEATETDHVVGRHEEVERVFGLVARHFNRSLVDLTETDQLGVSRPRLFDYYLAARHLERVSDHAVRTAEVVDRADWAAPDGTGAEVGTIGSEVRRIVEDASDAVVGDGSAAKAHAALDRSEGVVGDARKLDRALSTQSPAYPVARVLGNLVRTAERGGDIARIALRSSLRRAGRPDGRS